MPSHVRISATQTLVEDDPATIAALEAQFASRHAIVLDGFLERDVQQMLFQLRDSAQFRHDDVAGLGSRLLEAPPHVGRMLMFLLRRAPLGAWLQRVTRSLPISDVQGVVTRLHAGHDHRLDWHNDGGRGRVLGVTVNLGTEPYTGGRFEMRRQSTGELFLQHDHDRPGAALVFDVANDIYHRVTRLTAGGPRTVFSGWFFSADDPTVDHWAPPDGDGRHGIR
jgi:hypothetical protein